MPPALRGADALVRTLERAGIDTVFSLSGNHIMPVYDAAFGRPITLLHTRHEAAAVHMADAWARLTGEVGVALVSAGQGHANAVGALCTALAGETPLVLLSGHAPLNELGMGSFQEQDQAALAAPAAKAAWVVQSPGAVAGELARAMRLAASGRPGPVQLNLPSDVLEGFCGMPEAALPAEPPPPEPAALPRMLRALADAARPLVLAPPALATPQGRVLLARLEAALGVPVLAMESPRGVNDPAQGALAELLGQANLILLLGKALDFTLRFGGPPFAADAAWMVLEPEAALRDRAVRLLGARLALAAAAEPARAARWLAGGAAQAGMGSGHGAWRAAAQRLLGVRPPSWNDAADGLDGALHPVTIGRAVQDFFDRHGGVLVADGGEFSQWAQALVRAPERVINGPAGAIGPSLPFAIGAAVARPGVPVVAMLGDGTFGYHMAEFETALRHRLPVIAVIGNDGRWNAEHQIQCRSYGADRAHGCTLSPDIRYDLAVAALGGHGEFVTRAQDLPAALERAHASGRAACVNLRLLSLPAPTIRTVG
ncbi:thiamine pyrophosphate-binding protein [Roseomonas hellenica]|uniref:Thiamine pyrophosphate-binding protein n=1 Tax=Plastoroseomonas hellenica TaxID=2687306 RepID=A0ABS5F8W1_9PROT|nr:thiamine pyrophosphate-binding protein [Plastoroseomonas hellenica]MBR0669006.1 thiamine pyrophosphate-binding protein [Plastoroseomonas hellenica]